MVGLGPIGRALDSVYDASGDDHRVKGGRNLGIGSLTALVLTPQRHRWHNADGFSEPLRGSPWLAGVAHQKTRRDDQRGLDMGSFNGLWGAVLAQGLLLGKYLHKTYPTHKSQRRTPSPCCVC